MLVFLFLNGILFKKTIVYTDSQCVDLCVKTVCMWLCSKTREGGINNSRFIWRAHSHKRTLYFNVNNYGVEFMPKLYFTCDGPMPL